MKTTLPAGQRPQRLIDMIFLYASIFSFGFINCAYSVHDLLAACLLRYACNPVPFIRKLIFDGSAAPELNVRLIVSTHTQSYPSFIEAEQPVFAYNLAKYNADANRQPLQELLKHADVQAIVNISDRKAFFLRMKYPPLFLATFLF